MFWNKKVEKVKCETCKHYVDKGDAQEVITDSTSGSSLFKCPLHRVPYDKILLESMGRYDEILHLSYYKKIPEHFVKVNEKGQEIKIKK